ncbi:hypothetical protein J3Q64DRAFT_1372487 [Phycomyces blakesleeanus]|uniref:Uncharacterized protein n=1 Tax=Phycomyces blakesleeanus TaxID=4837 RepID=A0ABR3AJ68_PHYBL
MSQACKNIGLRFKLDLRLVVFKSDSEIIKCGTDEVAKKNGYIGFFGRLSDENVLRIMFSIIPIVVFDAHVSIIQLKSKGVYIVEEEIVEEL